MKVNEKKRKLILVSVTFALCLTIMLSGTFAWQSISQTAKNEAMGGIRNPGGRLHDDFNGSNKDIYVENFTKENEGQPIIVRIRLFEHMEIGENAGNPNNRDGIRILTKNAKDETKLSVLDDESTWQLHKYGEETSTEENPHTYWTWKMGGQTTYLPTFNINKDSLRADINGTYEGTNAGDNVHYDDYATYTVGEKVPGYEIYDADGNDIDEEKLSEERGEQLNIEGTNYTKSANEIEHTAKPTLDGEVISMAQWITQKNAELGNYWVYDTDGWAYWANPLEEEQATGLLLDKIILGEINERWYYGIYVECQMVTAEEIANVATAKIEKKGFYHKHTEDTDGKCTDTECPGITAQSLLSKIVDDIGYVEIENTAYEVYLSDLTAEEMQMLLKQEEENDEVEKETVEETETTDLEDLTETEETSVDKEQSKDDTTDEEESGENAETDTSKEETTTDTDNTPSDGTEDKDTIEENIGDATGDTADGTPSETTEHPPAETESDKTGETTTDKEQNEESITLGDGTDETNQTETASTGENSEQTNANPQTAI